MDSRRAPRGVRLEGCRKCIALGVASDQTSYDEPSYILGSKAMKIIVVAGILRYPGRLCATFFTTIGLVLALVLGFGQGAVAQENPVTAIDIALEPDATMLQHAK